VAGGDEAAAKILFRRWWGFRGTLIMSITLNGGNTFLLLGKLAPLGDLRLQRWSQAGTVGLPRRGSCCCSSFSKALASLRSAVSKPSLNQP